MSYKDPASWPEHLKAALLEQGGRFAPAERVLAIARLAEQLRQEVPEGEGEEDWRRVFALADNEHLRITERAEQIAEDLIAYVDAYAAGVEGAAADAYRFFQRDFKLHARAQMIVRLAFGIVRALEIDKDGLARLNETRFRTGITHDPETGRDYATGDDETAEQEHRAWRAAWIVRTVREQEYRELLVEERAYLDAIAERDMEEPLTDSTMATLEYLIEKVQPGWKDLTTLEGRAKLSAQLRERARAWLASSEFDGLEPEDAAFLRSARDLSDEDLTPAVCAQIERYRERVLRADAR